MGKQVVWSLRAQDDRKHILSSWRQRNKSNTYSKKLNLLFKDAIRVIKDYPRIGKLTDNKKARIKIVRDYLIIYEETETTLSILTIWDSQRDPLRLLKNIS